MMCNVVFVFLVSVICVQSHSIPEANLGSRLDKRSTAEITERLDSKSAKEPRVFPVDRNETPCKVGDHSSGNEDCLNNVTTTLAPPRAGKSGSSPHYGGRMPVGGAKDFSIDKEGPRRESRTNEFTESKWDSGINDDGGKIREETPDVKNHESRKKQGPSRGGGSPRSGPKRGKRSVQAPPEFRRKSGDSGATQEMFPVPRQKRDSGNGGRSKGDNPAKTSDNNRDDGEEDDNEEYDDFEDDDDPLQKQEPKGMHPRQGFEGGRILPGRGPPRKHARCFWIMTMPPQGGGGGGGGNDDYDYARYSRRKMSGKSQKQRMRSKKKKKIMGDGTPDST